MTMTHEKWREHEYYELDPFADTIQPALLNSVDIEKYVEKGCLIEDGDFNTDRLKTASYEIRFLGMLYDWEVKDDGRLQRRCREICDGEKIKLHRNSITYLWTKEKLLLPKYIAARFNLHIRHVHKGILLGTGPMIDPGFSGRWLIPLHNLTNNDYKLTGGDGIVWVEFTKVSRHVLGTIKSFPVKKDITTPEEYMEKSTILEHGVQSAFKGVLVKAQSDAEIARKSAIDASEETRRLKNLYTWIGLGSAITIVIAAVAAVIAAVAAIFGGYTLVNQVLDISNEIHRQIEIDKEISPKEIDVIQNNVANLEAKIDEYRTEVEALKVQLDSINKESDAGRNIVQ